MNFLFACGGTAGHINPALAVAGRLRELMPDCGILFVGADFNMEQDLVPRSGYDIITLRVNSLRRSRSPKAMCHNVKALVNVFRGKHKAKKILRSFAPDVVLGTGGYVCYPVLKAASELGIPTAVHESNAVPGLTTKMLSEVVDVIMVGFEESKKYYKQPEKTVVTGTPVRGEFGRCTKRSAREELGIPSGERLVVSVWGSLGASKMNEIMCRFIELAGKDPGFRLIHSAGSDGYAEMEAKLSETAPDHEKYGMEVREYIYDMPRVMAAADLVLCRAGASTISELTYMHKPTVFVPSPNVTNNHQYKNAKVVENAGGAKLFEEAGLTAETLLGEVRSILGDENELCAMSDSMAKLAVNDATATIIEKLLEMCGRK